ncbi:hypothetical protein A2V56_03530 [Candidatus Woesebacteria bacterium RBG_19FT_COMBO_42_9]|uniref:Uncharacterized protein n=1 Tax=Candidatus Woesebacteria bacterium RBG_16_42_24 TaxID=1802485 RepID=A0A1F7XKH6_9BACT|nr:MAG: hypothetical protein A2V97_00710 [Candidatus Woesebacteria bacterium RBG_16_42_24]OGM16124.1 MAG: hypothetical protein A2V56_03530 [Candidatus Woesebacteria bacterium RBG_19FT_COMBO_42_9]OGM67967.1 MAG: hypothetical protein A2985_02060 [Candidatus Woesebacteria bacterium RIFCSPLOWO2_01_FULL_43_11]
MINKIIIWFFALIFTYVAGYSINKGFFYIFSSFIIFIGSVFAVSLMNILIMALLDKRDGMKVDKKGFIWEISHNNLYKFPILLLILVSQLSIFAYYLSQNAKFESDLLMIEVLLAIIFAAIISSGKRK